jgi:eukaryotic-like serine/threonine-protein kinase
MNASTKTCPQCGAEMTSSTTEGLCPRCLFARLGESLSSDEIENDAEDDGTADSAGEKGGGKTADYELLEEIGQGGMGVVYRARQFSLNRPVAVKVIKLGMDTRGVMARFEAERRALAMMDHPNIARIFDAGTIGDAQSQIANPKSQNLLGRPYFVMELVRGVPITEYCQGHQLSIRQRLDLFIQVCNAVQHAHQKGVIHRDLKPSNILVGEGDPDSSGLPKIIDFGIAKAVEGRLADQTMFTAFEQFLGTPAYMSPEQATFSAADVDTRSDIYSLGVMLYELLTGTTPFDTKALLASGIDELRRVIRETRPIRPSNRLTRQACDSQSPIKNRQSKIDRDLDWIVMKCLEKEPARRYETAHGLAMDLRRHLSNQPVEARPPSRLYEFQKTVRRHKFGFAAVVAIVLVLSAGVIVSSWQASRARNAEREQSRFRETAEAQAYASDMNVAAQALKANDLGRTRDLLDQHRPKPDEKDRRGWEWRYLWDQSRSDALFELARLPNEIHSLAASRDGRWLAVGEAHSGGVEVWDLPARSILARLSEDEERSLAAFSPIAPLLAYTTFRVLEDGKRQSGLHLWNVETRKEEFTTVLDGQCVGLKFSGDGGKLVTSTSFQDGVAWVDAEGVITVWNVLHGGGLESREQHSSFHYGAELAMTDFAATHDLGLVAYGDADRKLHVVELATGKQLWEPARFPGTDVYALAFSPDGKTLAVSADTRDSVIRLWDVATQQEIGRLEGHAAYVTSLQFTPDGGGLISGSADQTIRIWDLATRKCVDVVRGHRQEVWRVKLLPDGKTLVSGAKDGTVLMWDISVRHPRNLRGLIRDTFMSWTFAPDGQSILAVDWRGRVTRHRVDDLREMETLLELNDPALRWRKGSLSENGEFLAAGSTNGLIHVWSLSKRKLEHRLMSPSGPTVIIGRFVKDDSLLLTVTREPSVAHLWDLRTGRLLHIWTPFDPVGDTATDPLRGELVEFGRNRQVRFLSVPEFQESTRQLNFLESGSASFSPDGKLFVLSSYMGYARVWDTANWTERVTLRGFPSEVTSLAFSPDGRRLVTGSGTNPDAALRLFDVETWLDVLTLEAEGSFFHIAKYSPDGNAIGLLDLYNNLTVWHAPSWEEIEAAENAVGTPTTMTGRMH